MPFHDLEVAWPHSFSHLRYTESAKRFPPNLFTIAVSVIPPEFLFQLKILADLSNFSFYLYIKVNTRYERDFLFERIRRDLRDERIAAKTGQ